MQGLQHEAVAAQRNDDLSALRGAEGVAVAKFLARPRRRVGFGRDDGDPRRRWTGHPPVTLMWRAIAGRLWRRSMMKSWPRGLRSIASRIAASSASSPCDLAQGGGQF